MRLGGLAPVLDEHLLAHHVTVGTDGQLRQPRRRRDIPSTPSGSCRSRRAACRRSERRVNTGRRRRDGPGTAGRWRDRADRDRPRSRPRSRGRRRRSGTELLTDGYIFSTPPFSATNTWPLGAKRTAVGVSRPVNATVSTKPGAIVLAPLVVERARLGSASAAHRVTTTSNAAEERLRRTALPAGARDVMWCPPKLGVQSFPGRQYLTGRGGRANCRRTAGPPKCRLSKGFPTSEQEGRQIPGVVNHHGAWAHRESARSSERACGRKQPAVPRHGANRCRVYDAKPQPGQIPADAGRAGRRGRSSAG